ncbi:hypothetical protein V8C43DRAFT_289364 [Trichoderma afarasin]
MAHDCVVGLVMGVSRLGMGFFLGICPLWPGFYVLLYCITCWVFALDALTVWCSTTLLFLFLIAEEISQERCQGDSRLGDARRFLVSALSSLVTSHSPRLAGIWDQLTAGD